MIVDILFLVALAALAAGLLTAARKKYAPETGELIRLINAELPQTQCAQCGYPGCLPYARAVAGGEAIDLCPPGGAQTAAALATLLGRAPEHPGRAADAPPALARIREDECIGCSLCVPACPVDAILGAPQSMHTVVEAECTGCELCLAPCPVDCIEMIHPAPATPPALREHDRPCINCGACAGVCPRGLQPQLLYWHREQGDKANAHRLQQCIECASCDAVCPSGIPLAHTFGVMKARAREKARGGRRARRAEERFRRHTQRLEERRNPARPGEDARAALLKALEPQP